MLSNQKNLTSLGLWNCLLFYSLHSVFWNFKLYNSYHSPGNPVQVTVGMVVVHFVGVREMEEVRHPLLTLLKTVWKEADSSSHQLLWNCYQLFTIFQTAILYFNYAWWEAKLKISFLRFQHHKWDLWYSTHMCQRLCPLGRFLSYGCWQVIVDNHEILWAHGTRQRTPWKLL